MSLSACPAVAQANMLHHSDQHCAVAKREGSAQVQPLPSERFAAPLASPDAGASMAEEEGGFLFAVLFA